MRGISGYLVCFAVFLHGCAPVIKEFQFDGNSPLHGKRIGVVYSRSGVPGSEGVDERDLREFLGALGKGLGNHARNVEFVNLTGRDNWGPPKRIIKKEPKLLGDSVKALYTLPDSTSLQSLSDSLDFVFSIGELFFSGGSPWMDTTGSRPNFGAFPSGPSIPVARTMGGGLVATVGINLPEGDSRGSDQEWTTLRYVIWNIGKHEAITFDEARMKQSKSFGGETTTFAQDGERMGQIILKKLQKPRKTALVGTPR